MDDELRGKIIAESMMGGGASVDPPSRGQAVFAILLVVVFVATIISFAFFKPPQKPVHVVSPPCDTACYDQRRRGERQFYGTLGGVL